ncbi:hypothetical protein [Caldimonas sp. KR1-144]|uniref:hypothetical protein n=1 Tax=Caldimonas sp. KR1-144 TaxID=3400911 RepID=UPI003BFB6976
MRIEERERFEREYGCTEAEWLGWMPGATQGLPLEMAAAALVVRIGAGRLDIAWTVLPPRRIALMRLPRLGVRFAFDGVPVEARREFMRGFDLRLQRGGG